MNALVTLPLVAPLVGAAVALMAHGRLGIQRVTSLVGVGVAAVASLLLLVDVAAGSTRVVHVGGWSAPVGITLVADAFGVLLLAVGVATALGVLVYSIGQLSDAVEQRFFHPLYGVLVAGVALSFLTGDLFNLFVAFEVMLIASYVLLTLASGRAGIRPAMTYVVINLLASTLFITAVGFMYAATGTVNLADLALRVADLPPGLVRALSLLLLVVFGIKAALFPLFGWLPDSYPTAPAAITALFAGLLTKVGVYAIIRTQTVLFPLDGPDGVVLVIAGLTMIVGVLGAIAQEDIGRILSFHIVSQIGYMVLGLGLFTAAGLAGAALFIAHQIPVKTALFLVGGMVQRAAGTTRLAALGGLVGRMPLAAGLFLVSALSLAGLPPFSGFFGKLALVQAGFAAEAWTISAIALGGGILTLFSMTKIWAGAFWGAPAEPAPIPVDDGDGRIATHPAMAIGAVGVVGLTLVIALGAGPAGALATRAGEEMADRSHYVEAVLGAGAAAALDDPVTAGHGTVEP